MDELVRRRPRRHVGVTLAILLGAGMAVAGIGMALRSSGRKVGSDALSAVPTPAPVRVRTIVPSVDSETAPTLTDMNLDVFTATYVGGPGEDAPVAVAIMDANTILYGGNFPQADLGTPPHDLLGGGDAALVRLGREGRQVSRVTRIGRSIVDMKVDRQGHVLVLGQPFGLAALDQDAREVLWREDVLGTRLSVGSDGTVAVLNGLDGAVQVLSSEGRRLASFSLASAVETLSDIAVHGASKTIVVTGTRLGMPKQPLVRAYGYDGALRWQTYGWTDTEARQRNLTAASTGIRVLVGPDDRLFFLGVSNGGNSTFLRQGRDLDIPLRELVTFDEYTSPANVGNQNLLVVARLDPRDGAVEALIFHLTRGRDNGKGGTMNPQAMAVDAEGRVLVTGYQTQFMERYDERTVAGHPVRPGGRDAFVLGLDPDLRGRWLWSTWGTGAPSVGVAVALGHGVGAMAALQERSAFERAPLVTASALHPLPLGGPTDGYLAVWPVPPAPR